MQTNTLGLLLDLFIKLAHNIIIHYFKYLKQKGYIEKNPFVLIKSPKKAIRFPDTRYVEDVDKLLNANMERTDKLKVRDQAIIELLYASGVRASELVNIEYKDIDARSRTIRIIGKGNKERTVYLNDSCVKAIEDWLNVRSTLKIKPEAKNALFVSKRGLRLSEDMIQINIKRLLAMSGLDTNTYSVHKLRHTAATLMYKYGHVDLRSLQTILGHANVSTTQIYTHVDDELLHKAVESNPLSDYNPKDE